MLGPTLRILFYDFMYFLFSVFIISPRFSLSVFFFFYVFNDLGGIFCVQSVTLMILCSSVHIYGTEGDAYISCGFTGSVQNSSYPRQVESQRVRGSQSWG